MQNNPTQFEAIERQMGRQQDPMLSGPSDIFEATGESRPLTKEDRLLIDKTLGQLGVASRRLNGADTSTKPAPAITETGGNRILINVLREGAFEVSIAEVRELRELQADVAEFDRQIAEYSPTEISKRHKAGKAHELIPSLEELTTRGLDYRRGLKERKRQRIAEFAPTALAIAKRAIDICDGTAGLLQAAEEDKAAAYGIEFIASHTLEAIRKTPECLRQFHICAHRSPDMIDPSIIARVVDHFVNE